MSRTLRPSTYDAIIEAAFTELNARPTASLADIAVAAGVGRATLHRHFTGRSDLIRALAMQALKETETAADTAAADARSYKDALQKILSAMIVLGDRHWFLAQEPIRQFEEVRIILDRQDDEFRQLLEAAKREGVFHRSCPTEWAAQTYDHLIHAAWEMVRDGHTTTKQASALAWVTLRKGLKHAKL